jgi:Uma2 family endonuclease
MSTLAPMTAQQLLLLSPQQRCELVSGELRMMSPAGWQHGKIVHRIEMLLGNHVDAHDLGDVFGAETGFLIASDPDTVRAPDVAFIAQVNLPEGQPQQAFWPGPPDLAVEVLSPHDKTGDVDEKINDWLKAGTKLLWIVDPQLRIVTVYRSITDVSVKTAADRLTGEDVVSGFQCAVADIFKDLPR